MYSLENLMLPYNEKIYTVLKDKNLIIREYTYLKSKIPFKISLEKYYLIAYNDETILAEDKYHKNDSLAMSLSTIINEYISIERYSRSIKYEESIEKQNFFLLKCCMTLNSTNKNILDSYYKTIINYSKNIEKWVTTLGIELIPLSSTTIQKLMNYAILTLKDLNVDLDTPKKIFSANYKDIDIFTMSKRLSLINRPMHAQPALPITFRLGTNLRGESEVGIESTKLLIIGNNYLKNYTLIQKIYDQIYEPDDLLVIFNFRSIPLKLPYNKDWPVKEIKMSQLDVDPFQLPNEYPEHGLTFIPIIKNMFIHALQLIPSIRDTLKGTLTDYMQKSVEHNDTISIGGYIKYLMLKMEISTVEGSNTNEEFEKMDINMLSTVGGTKTDKSVETVYNEINYLYKIISRPSLIPIKTIVQKKGILILSNENQAIETSVLAYSLVLEYLDLMKANYKIITLGLEKFLSTITFDNKESMRIIYQKYFNQNTTICELDNIYYEFMNIFNYDKLNIVYTSNVALRTEGNYEKITEMLNIITTQSEVYALLRYDYNAFLYFILPQDQNKPALTSGSNTTFPQLSLELTDNIALYELVEKMSTLPEYMCVPQYVAFLSNDYWEGKKCLELMMKLNYIKKASLFYKHYILTDEIKVFLTTINEYFKQFDKKTINTVSEVSTKEIHVQLQGLISFYLPIKRWDLIMIYFMLLQQKINTDTATEQLKQILIQDKVKMFPTSNVDTNDNHDQDKQVDLTQPPNVSKNTTTELAPGFLPTDLDEEEIQINETNPNTIKDDKYDSFIVENDDSIDKLIPTTEPTYDISESEENIGTKRLTTLTILKEDIPFVKWDNVNEKLDAIATTLGIKTNESFSSLLLLAIMNSSNTLSNLLSVIDEMHSKE